MTDFVYEEVTEGICIEVVPAFISERSNPRMNYYFYAYTVTISNKSEVACQLLKRHWIIRDGKGQEEHVLGDGVVGETPILKPGERFVYTSACPLSTPTGNMRGEYHMIGIDDEREFKAKIPLFFLRPSPNHPEHNPIQ